MYSLEIVVESIKNLFDAATPNINETLFFPYFQLQLSEINKFKQKKN